MRAISSASDVRAGRTNPSATIPEPTQEETQVSERTVASGGWWHGNRGRVLIVVALSVVVAVIDVLFAPRHGFFDLDVYYGAINYWADGGEIYDFVRERSTY